MAGSSKTEIADTLQREFGGDWYAAYVIEQVEAAKQICADPVVLIEQRVDFSRWVESGYGTADCIIIADGTLQIIDYKHAFLPKSNRGKYCPDCAARVHRRQKTESERKRRSCVDS